MNLAFENVRLPLADFDLALDLRLAGRVTAVFGPSGAGKTSLLEIVTGLRRPESGRVTLDAVVLSDAAARLHLPPSRRAIGYVPQDGALFPHLNVRENLRYGARRAANPAPGLDYDHVVAVLEIGALAGRDVASLSGGEKQRVALGRALLSSPRLLLLDEPLAGLDLALKERLLPCLRRARDEFAVPMLVVTHSPDEVMALCDDVVLLEKGRVIGHDSPAAVFVADDTPRHRLRDTPPRD